MTSDVLATSEMGTREIHEAIKGAVHSGSAIYQLNIEALREANPDLILTQELCAVCAVSYTEVARAARVLDGDAKVISLEPRTLDDILGHVLLVGELTGVASRAEKVVAELRARLERLEEDVRSRVPLTVGSIEWMDPVFNAGHWVPDQVAAAGGVEVLGKAGEHSREVSWETVVAADPEVLLLMPCGHGIDRAERDLELLSSHRGWAELRAVTQGEVWALDGPSYFNRPGPRTVRGAEVIAAVLHGVGAFDASEARLLKA